MSPYAAVIIIVPRKVGKMIRFVCRKWSIAPIVSVYPLQWTRRVHDTLAGAVFLCTEVKPRLASDTMQDASRLQRENLFSAHSQHLFILTKTQTHNFIVYLEATHTHTHTCTHTCTHICAHIHSGA